MLIAYLTTGQKIKAENVKIPTAYTGKKTLQKEKILSWSINNLKVVLTWEYTILIVQECSSWKFVHYQTRKWIPQMPMSWIITLSR